MAYNPTDWKNREVEKPRTFEFLDNLDGTTTLIPAEGTVTEAGTPIMAANMNKIEAELVKAAAHILNSNNPHGVTTEQINILSDFPYFLDNIGKYPLGISTGRANQDGGFGWQGWGSVTTFRYEVNGSGSFQFFSPHDESYGTNLEYRRWVIGVGWSGFEKLVTSKLPPRINAILNAGWSDEGVKFYKDSFGVVHVNGYVAMGVSPSHSITDFPVGYRPSANVSTGAIVFEAGGAQSGSCRLIVGVDGSLKYFLMPSFTVNNILLDFSFRTD